MSSGCFAAIAFGLLLMVFGLLHLGFRKWEDLSVIIKIGLPSFFRQGLASIATAMLNINFAVCGDVAAARHRADAAAGRRAEFHHLFSVSDSVLSSIESEDRGTERGII